MDLSGILGMFDFSLASLQVAEIMPKRAAAHLWVRNLPMMHEELLADQGNRLFLCKSMS